MTVSNTISVGVIEFILLVLSLLELHDWVSSFVFPNVVPSSSSVVPSREISELSASVADLTKAFAGQQKLLLDLMSQVANTSHSHAVDAAVSVGAPLVPSMRHKPASVEMPRFHGDNPESWVFQAERYFDFYNISEDHKLSLASFYLDGEAREWYR